MIMMLVFLGSSSLSRLCMPDILIVIQNLSCILKTHYVIRRLDRACSTTAFASEPPGAVNGGAEKEKEY